MNRHHFFKGRSGCPVSSRYHREHVVPLQNGRRFRVRPVRPSDEPSLEDLLKRLSSEEIRLRFFGPARRFSHRFVGPLAESDDRRFGLVAMLAEDAAEQFIASAMLVAEADNAVAEFAVLVHHDHTQHGLGRYLLECLLEHARASHVGTVFGLVLSENENMLQLARELGFSQRPDPDESGCFRVELVTDPATAQAVSIPASEST